MLEVGVDEGEAVEGRLVHGVDEVLVAEGQPRLLTQELPVKVAAVVGRFLGLKGNRGQLT